MLPPVLCWLLHSIFSVTCPLQLDKYHSHAEINTWLQQLSTTYKDFVGLVNLGYTTEGRSMLALKIGNRGNGTKVAFWIDGGMHPREWISIAVAVWMINQLVNTRPKYLDCIDFYILPVANPDGYEYTRNYDRFWRQTRSGCTSLSPDECCGVDLNRNWDFHWNEVGTSDTPCNASAYAGHSPFSEPEARNIASYLTKIKSNLQGFITLHSFSALWLHGYSYTTAVDPPHMEELVELSARAVAAMRTAGTTNYQAVTSADLYPAAGVSDDWVTGVLGIKYSFTIELPPEASKVQTVEGFVVDESLIVPIAVEAWAGVSTVIDRVVQNAQCKCCCCRN